MKKLKIVQWLLQQLDQETVPCFRWWDRQKGLIRIPWSHRSSGSWRKSDTMLFLLWAQHKGKQGRENDYKKLKATFRCALNSRPELKEVRQLRTKNWRVWQIIRTNTECEKTPKKRRQTLEEKRPESEKILTAYMKEEQQAPTDKMKEEQESTEDPKSAHYCGISATGGDKLPSITTLFLRLSGSSEAATEASPAAPTTAPTVFNKEVLGERIFAPLDPNTSPITSTTGIPHGEIGNKRADLLQNDLWSKGKASDGQCCLPFSVWHTPSYKEDAVASRAACNNLRPGWPLDCFGGMEMSSTSLSSDQLEDSFRCIISC